MLKKSIIKTLFAPFRTLGRLLLLITKSISYDMRSLTVKGSETRGDGGNIKNRTKKELKKQNNQ